MALVSNIKLLCFCIFLCFLIVNQLSAQTGLTIIQPNGGEFFQSTDSVLIKWLNPSNLPVNLYYSSDDGSTWMIIAENIAGTQYMWTDLRSIESDSLKIKITDANPIKPTVYGFNTGNPQYSFDGNYIVIFNDSFVEIYSAEDYSLINTYFISNTLNCSVNPSKNEILITYKNGDIEVKEFPSGKTASFVKTGLSLSYRAIYSPDNLRIAVLTKDSKINIYIADGLTFQKSVQLPDTAYYINWVNEETIGVISYENFSTSFYLIDINIGMTIFQEKGISEYTSGVFSVSPDKKYFLLAMGNATLVYSMTDLKRIYTLTGKKFIDYASAWSKDSKLLYLANGDSTLRVLDTDWFLQRDIFYNSSGYINTISFSPDETKMLFHDRYNHYKVISIPDFDIQKILITPPSKEIKVNISPDSRTVASFGSDSTLRFWDSFVNEKLLYSETSSLGPFNGVDWSPDGKLIAVTRDKEVIIKTTTDYHDILKIDFTQISPTVIKIFPKLWTLDSKYYSVQNGDTVYYFDVNTGLLFAKFQSYTLSLTRTSDLILIQPDQFSLKYFSLSTNQVFDEAKTSTWIPNTKLHPTRNKLFFVDLYQNRLRMLRSFDIETQEFADEYDCNCYEIRDFNFDDKGDVLMIIDTITSGSIHNLALVLTDLNYSQKMNRYFPTIFYSDSYLKWLKGSQRYLYANKYIPFIDTLGVLIEEDISDNFFSIGCPKLTVNNISFGKLTESSSDEILFRNIIQNENITPITIDSVRFSGSKENSIILIEPSTPVVVNSGESLDLKLKANFTGSDTSESIIKVYTKCGTYNIDISAIFDLKPLTIFPNPTNDVITIQVKCERTGVFKLKIYDLKGRLAESKEWTITNLNSDVLLRTYRISMTLFAQASYYVFFETPDTVYSDGFVYCKE